MDVSSHRLQCLFSQVPRILSPCQDLVSACHEMQEHTALPLRAAESLGHFSLCRSLSFSTYSVLCGAPFHKTMLRAVVALIM